MEIKFNQNSNQIKFGWLGGLSTRVLAAVAKGCSATSLFANPLRLSHVCSFKNLQSLSIQIQLLFKSDSN